jgi:hypothetical protein
MTDDDMTLIIHETLADTHMTTPVTDILRRGEHLRARRRRTRSGVLVALATVGVVVTGLALAYAPHSSTGKTGKVELAAFTVTRRSADSVSVTVRQLTDLSGLQTELRADGIPVLVTNSINVPTGCTEWDGGHYSTAHAVTLANPSGLPDSNGIEFSIHPSGIPQGAILSLGLLQTGAPAGSPGPAGPMSVGLVTDTPTCRSS